MRRSKNGSHKGLGSMVLRLYLECSSQECEAEGIFDLLSSTENHDQTASTSRGLAEAARTVDADTR